MKLVLTNDPFSQKKLTIELKSCLKSDVNKLGF